MLKSKKEKAISVKALTAMGKAMDEAAKAASLCFKEFGRAMVLVNKTMVFEDRLLKIKTLIPGVDLKDFRKNVYKMAEESRSSSLYCLDICIGRAFNGEKMPWEDKEIT